MEYLLYLVLSYCYASLAECLSHRWVMHRRLSALPGIYLDHATHHGIYQRDSFSRLSGPEKRYGNLEICLEHSLVFCIPLALVAFPLVPAFSITLLIFSVCHFFFYNAVHTALHLRHDIPWLPAVVRKALAENHYLHHVYPDKNFCVSLLGADYLFGTAAKSESWIEAGEKPTKEQVIADKAGVDRANYCFFPARLKQLKRLSTCGFIPPTPTQSQVSAGKKLCKVITALFIGNVEIRGELPDYPVLVVTNHSSWKDIFVHQVLSRRPLRIMGHSCVIGFAGGLFANLLTKYIGLVPIASSKGVDSAVSLLNSEQTVVICPEGYTWLDGVMRPFKTGAVRIAQSSGKEIVPVYIRYGSYDGNWIVTLPPVLQYVLSILSLRHRSGAVVVIGKPISNLPTDVKQATAELFQRVSELDPS